MPTYQYACTACGHQLEAVQKFTDEPLTQCPECEGHLRKLFSSVGVVFKGSGFYRTDSRAGNSKSEAASSSSAGDSAKSDSSSTSEKSTSTTSAKDSGSSSSSSSSSGSKSSTPASTAA